MKTFTVLLLYPDYLTENYGETTYLTSVEASSVEEAQTIAQKQAWHASFPDEEFGDFEDFGVLIVILGEHEDIKEI